MEVTPEQIINELLEDIKRLTIDNAVMRSALNKEKTPPPATLPE